MSFEWTEDIQKGAAFITKAVIEEIRSNLDSIKDDEACGADKVSYNAAQNTVVDDGYNATHYNDQHSSYNNDVNTGVDTGYKSTDRTDHDEGVNSVYYLDDNTNHNSGVLYTHYADAKAPV